ncbi:MAG TPA: class E sortase [Thermoleophilaceae bacterium]|nr:class E sortase [Thermoleophilaceae bacterium]
MTVGRTNPWRAALRFLGSVLMVSGILMIADAGITLAWQEPVSAFFAERQQRQLEEELLDPPPEVKERVRERRPLPGDAIGEIVLPSLDKRFFVVEGTQTDNLRKGPAHYPDTPLPGERGTVAIAGHRTTYGAPFRNIDQLKRGQRIVLSMPYGRYVYRVEKEQIVDDSALWITDPVGYNRLVLSACHPLYSAAQRLVVFARLGRRLPPSVKRN